MTTISKKVATAGITTLNVSEIKTNRYNPRKSFAEKELQELAESIKQLGVLQPILVRPKGKKYEIIFGERRYKAVILAGLTEIPANIRELSDEDAMDMAITENLQRQDISPIEEANAFQSLIGSKRYDVASLVLKFGKSESYIRSRLKLNDLVSDFKDLLLSDGISLSVAMELVKYSQEIQQDVYNRHFADDNYSNWEGLNASKLAKNIENGYTTDLNRYFFDKTDCMACPFNSSNFSLFGAENPQGQCSKSDCLHQKNVAYLTAQADSFIEKNPSLSLCTNACSCNNADTEAVVENLKEKGHQLINMEHRLYFPEEPAMPRQDDYEVPETYNKAVAEYDSDLLEYNAQIHEITEWEQAGKVNVFACVGAQKIELYYAKNENKEDGTSTIPMAIILKNKDKRNKEIAVEKIVDETRKLIRETEMPLSDFTEFEDKLLYFAMLTDLKREHIHFFSEHPENWYLTEDEKISAINNLTEEQRTIIRRDYLVKHLSDTYGISKKSYLMLEFARLHFPDTLAETEEQHTAVYQKRHERLEERIIALNNQQEVA